MRVAGTRRRHAVLRVAPRAPLRCATVPRGNPVSGLRRMAVGGRRRTCAASRRRSRDRRRPGCGGVRRRTAARASAGSVLHVVPAVFDVPREPGGGAIVADSLRTSRGASMTKDLFDIGEIPEIGTVPARMHAQLVRPERFGEPRDSIKDEVIDVPEIGPNEALVMVMAAGVNFNNVWAARGVPVDVTKTQARWGEPTDFHIVGSDAAGVVFAVGDRVTDVRVGDQVVVHAGQWDLDDPWVTGGNDPGLAPTFRVWGYDTCWGSFAQFTKVQAHQCLPMAERLTWEEAAAPTLTGSTAYRMLHGWPPNTVKEGDVVLVWGGSGGLGSLAIQLVKLAGGRAVAVVSSEEKGEYCKGLGAVGYVNRREFDHWGTPPAWDAPEWKAWFEGAK